MSQELLYYLCLLHHHHHHHHYYNFPLRETSFFLFLTCWYYDLISFQLMNGLSYCDEYYRRCYYYQIEYFGGGAAFRQLLF
jgi:hypothetical protein